MKIRLAILFAAALFAPMTHAAPAPATAPKESAEQVRIARLAALAKIWGQARYAHPAFASRELDWDRALLEAIPRVNAARDTNQFRGALDGMLATLGDPATHVLPTSAPAPAAAAKVDDAPAIVRGADGVVRIDFARLSAQAAAGGSMQARNEQVAALVAALPEAKALVLDARSQASPEDDWFSGEMLSGFLAKALPSTLRTGALRYRSYSGYPSQTGDLGTGGYYAGVLTQVPAEIVGTAKAPLPPMVIVTNANTALPGTVLVGLQAAGLAQVVAEDGAVPLGSLERFSLREGVEVQMNVADIVAPDGVVGVRADFSAPAKGIDAAIAKALVAAAQPPARRNATTLAALPLPDRDRDYAGIGLPSPEMRLLALFRFWSVFERFFPYKPLIGPGWDDVLQRYIPQFEANRDLADYELTLRKLTAESHDSHVGLRSAMASAERLGRWNPPVLLRWVEEQTMVSALVEDGTGLRVGDVVERIDGNPTQARRDYIGQYISASTPQAWQRNVHRNLLRGQPQSSVRLEVRGVDGQRRTVTLQRTVGPEDMRLQQADFKPRPQPVFGVLPSGLGYVDLARLKPAEVDAMFTAIAATPATIFDMRGYPNGTAWSVAPRLGTREEPVGARFRRTLYEADDPEQGLVSLEFEQRVPPSDAARYPGKVVMLIDENAQSQSEHTGLFFEAATKTTFIGTPTAGANGDVTTLVLPGGYGVSFSGHDVRHADGRQLQRIGLQPDVRVAPTIAGLARGEDEVLAAAEKWLREHP